MIIDIRGEDEQENVEQPEATDERREYVEELELEIVPVQPSKQHSKTDEAIIRQNILWTIN